MGSRALFVAPHVRESRFRNPGNFSWWNSEPWALESGIQLKESGIPLRLQIWSEIHGVESRILDCSGFPCMGRLVC